MLGTIAGLSILVVCLIILLVTSYKTIKIYENEPYIDIVNYVNEKIKPNKIQIIERLELLVIILESTNYLSESNYNKIIYQFFLDTNEQCISYKLCKKLLIEQISGNYSVNKDKDRINKIRKLTKEIEEGNFIL